MEDLSKKTEEELRAIEQGSSANAYLPQSIFHAVQREKERRYRKIVKSSLKGFKLKVLPKKEKNEISQKVLSVLKKIKNQIDITSHEQLGWTRKTKKNQEMKKVVVVTSEAWKRLGLKLIVRETLNECNINYSDLEEILKKIQELKFIKSSFLVNDEIGGQSDYFKIVPEKNFYKLYDQVNLDKSSEKKTETSLSEIIFPQAIIDKLPKDVGNLCSEFNFNFSNKKILASMLLLRKLLPLSIVRKFKIMGKELEVKNGGDYLDTKALLGKIESHLTEKRIYTEVMNYKLLVDSSQHSYTFVPQPEDVKGAALVIRVFLEHLF
jgi:hypothetical protein